MSADTEVHISGFAELIATALVAGYRDEQKRQLLADAAPRWQDRQTIQHSGHTSNHAEPTTLSLRIALHRQ
jgi:hypothetical protein